MSKSKNITSIVISLLLYSAPGLAHSVHNGLLNLDCHLDNKDSLLSCQYRFTQSQAPATGISASVGTTPLSLSNVDTYPTNDSNSEIMLLVDTSDPGREHAVRKIAKAIDNLVDSKNDIDKIGLYSFDKELVELSAIGSSVSDLKAASDKLHATGETTELYRNVLSAIHLLSKTSADRKSIFLFSDGIAEDKAYYHSDVIKAATGAGVIINGFGYPRSISKSVSLQTIRRLSDESFGVYTEADNNFNLPDNYAKTVFSSVDNGGGFVIKIPDNLLSKTEKEINIDINIKTSGQTFPIRYPLQNPNFEPGVEIQKIVTIDKSTASSSDQAVQPVKIITEEQPQENINYWFWYGIPILMLIILVVTIIFFSIITFRQNGKRSKNKPAAGNEFKPFAYLVTQDERKHRYAITRTTWRIGRGRDNEMVLNDNSVSRRHAEINRDKGGVFTLFDLDSLNGVFVGGERVSKHILHEGDIIEIGDVCLRFTLLSSEFTLEESTVMQNTRAPLAH